MQDLSGTDLVILIPTSLYATPDQIELEIKSYG
jgi:hypothetical protein